ncbi:hypothetical protein ACHAQA_002852 [Verticillium albo-atrum]
MSDSEDLAEIPEIPEDGADDLFGDDSDENEILPASDRELNSDDDDVPAKRADRYDQDEDHFHSTQNNVVETTQVSRHRVPRPKNGQLQSLRVPKFIQVLPELYNRENFEPTDRDVQNAKADNPKAEVRVRKDRATGQLQSNTLIHRWSDGSLTVSVGDEHFEIHTKSLAPAADKPYKEVHDAHYYAAAPNLSSNHFMMVGHVSEQYTVRPGKAMEDDALAKLAERMAAVSRGVHEGDMIIKTTSDPMLQIKQAELAEKERMKAQRRRETAAAKMDGPQRYGRGAGGLSIGDLEGGRRGAGRKRGAGGGAKEKRRRPEYDSDDDLPSGARRVGDDYDLEDDFIAGSDEDVSEGGDDDEEEILDDDDEEEEEAPRRKRQRTADADDDGHGDASGRARRRQVIDDEDEDED